MKKKIYIEGDGCNRRLLELTKIRSYLEANDYEIVKGPETADYILAGTCAFKEREENDSVSRLRDLKKYGRQLLVYGCLPDIAPEKYEEFADVKKLAPKDIDKIDVFFDGISKNFEDVPDFNQIENVSGSMLRVARGKIKSKEIYEKEFYRRGIAAAVRSIRKVCLKEKEAYFLNVSRGCLGKCSYCAIRMAVGTVRSKPLDQVKIEFLSGVEKGYRSFTILGDDPGCYGLDKESSFPELLNLLLEEVENQKRVREARNITLSINEIHPKFLVRYGKEIGECIQKYPGVIKSILCPVQSGSDRVLGLMQREHNSAQIEEVLGKLSGLDRDINFSTHIIVGFPSETRADLEKTWSLVNESRFKSVVIFPYHDKKHTSASALENKIKPKEVKNREKESFRYFKNAGIQAFRKCPK